MENEQADEGRDSRTCLGEIIFFQARTSPRKKGKKNFSADRFIYAQCGDVVMSQKSKVGRA